MDLSLDYFKNFALNRSFVVSSVDLAQRHRELQQIYHPDRFVGASATEQRQAIQTAAYINEAYHTLKLPLKRAIYLLELEGMEPLSPTNTHMPQDFLLQQMLWRERMEDLAASQADSDQLVTKMAALQEDLSTTQQQLQQAFAEYYSRQQWQVSETLVRKMQFIHKLLIELDEIEDQLL